MTEKTVAEKARVKAGATVSVIDPEPGVVESLGLPADTSFTDPSRAQLVFLFVRDGDGLRATLPGVVANLATSADLWVFYRKGSKVAGMTVNRDDVWAVAEGLGMRPLGLLSVDDSWSAFRLRPGK